MDFHSFSQVVEIVEKVLIFQQFGRKKVCVKMQEMEKKRVEKQKRVEKEGNNFYENLEKSCKKLVYMSETDADFTVFVGNEAEAVTKEEILKQTKSSPNTLIEEKSFDEFFLRLTEIQDWFAAEQKQMAEKFSTLEKLLRENLISKKVFRIGKIQIDIYVVGLDAENKLVGVKTKAVET